ncbi:MAG: polymer-forming cytoskeletal protein [Alphaproteobacteria bacterium]|nr:polymer-forming cytoskeletal protein [Alphaproteobacteria bacterium]
MSEPPRMKTSAMPSIVSAGLQVTGNMTSDGDIQIEGTITGDVKSRTITVGTDGLVQGQLIAESVQVSGAVEGKIRAKTVVLVAGARMIGDVVHDVLTVEPGAQVEGALKRYSKPEAIEPEVAANSEKEGRPELKSVAGGRPQVAAVAKSGS